MRKCRICKQKYTPKSQMLPICDDFECRVAYATQIAEKSAQKRVKEAKQKALAEKREHKAKLQATNKLSWFVNRAQIAFNSYIRARDYGKPCICCGEPIDWITPLQANAGHWRTVAAAGHLRFNEDNVHGQRAYCNSYGAGNQAAMEQGMIARIGIERVEALRNNNGVHNWTREELTEIWKTYQVKTKELKEKGA